jgi:hypothetical protein
MSERSRVRTATDEDLLRIFGPERLLIGFPVSPGDDDAPAEEPVGFRNGVAVRGFSRRSPRPLLGRVSPLMTGRPGRPIPRGRAPESGALGLNAADLVFPRARETT